MRKLWLAGLLMSALMLSGAPWSEDFSSSLRQWQVNATQFLVPKTNFFARKTPQTRGGKVLVVECRKSTGAYIRPLIGCVDLEKTPILHWRWRVRALPGGADGRYCRIDDQPIAIYLVAGGLLARRGVAYRWESDTPLEHIGDLRYSSTMHIRSHCVRNKTSPRHEWVEETRNVRDDFKNAFGYVPRDFAISVCGNSQHTESYTAAELDFIEFLPEPTSSNFTQEKVEL